MKNYIIIGSIFFVLVLGSLFLFTKRIIEVETVHYRTDKIDEVLAVLDFEIKTPTFLHENSVLSEATITVVDNEHRMIGFRYTNENNSFDFEFSAAFSKESLKDIAENDEYWHWTETEVSGYPALIGVNDISRERNIVLRIEDISYRFYSQKMDTENLLKIASSLK